MIRASLLTLLGLASFVTVYLVMDPRATEPELDAEPAMPGQSLALADAALDAAAASPKNGSRLSEVGFELRPGAGQATVEGAQPEPVIAARDVRNVTPPEITSGPKVKGRLTRVEPEDTPEAPQAEPEARVERLFKPIVVAADTFKARGREIRLAGIVAPGFDERCGEGEAAWPCGRMARSALRRFVRSRAIECDVPGGAEDIPDPATCRVAGEDLAKWLVAQGWAKRGGEPYVEEETAAREAKLGLWNEKRPDDQAEVASSG